VLRFNARAAFPLYAELAEIVPGRSGSGAVATPRSRADDFIAAIVALMDESGAPRRLRDVGVTEDALPRLAADAMLQTRLLINNPVEIDEQAALDLYREAY
jgi:alcohol dehydrogenase class IV